MRVAAIYDIHGNFPALEAALEAVRESGADRLVVGGDVLPGPMPAECMDRLLRMDVRTDFILGNGDRAVLAHMRGEEVTAVPERVRPAVAWCADQLNASHAAALEGWPASLRLDVQPLGEVVFCHATAQNDTDIVTRRTSPERMLAVFAGLDAPVVVCGHTHMAYDRHAGPLRVVNAGSVGMPFGAPGAHWLLIGPAVQLCHKSYDLEAAATRIRATSYPGAAEFADRHVLAPPSEREMLDLYESAASVRADSDD